MSRQTNKLTARAVAAQDRPGLYSDGGGLYLQVARGGSKSWVYRFMLRRRSRDMGLSGIDVVSLAEAREKALEARKLVKAGIDPIEDRNAQRARLAVDTASSRTFQDCAEKFIACLSGYHPHPLYVVCLLGLQARAGAGALRRRSG